MRGVFLNDGWYVAAWSDELTDRPFARTLLGQPVLLSRRSDGSPVALEAGRRSYPVVEQHRCIWVWTGDPARADRATIRDFHWLEHPGWSLTRIHRRVACHYQLIIDNLLDLSHLADGHGAAVGDSEPTERAQIQTDRLPDGVRVSRWTCDVPPARRDRELGGHDGNIDRWQIAEFRAPGTFVIDTGAARAGTGAADGLPGEQRWGFVVCQGITPETERTTNCFWALAHAFGADDRDGVAAFHRQSHLAFDEDVAVFEAQQRVIDLDPEAPTIDISYDAGPLQARRLIERLIASQEAGAHRLAQV
jgi:phenylpropionate dioxygenase-like ring-hydroxylating dioxygenase large terminal subunit